MAILITKWRARVTCHRRQTLALTSEAACNIHSADSALCRLCRLFTFGNNTFRPTDVSLGGVRVAIAGCCGRVRKTLFGGSSAPLRPVSRLCLLVVVISASILRSVRFRSMRADADPGLQKWETRESMH